MCCGKRQQAPISARIMQMNNDYTSSLNYLGTDINTTWQAPSKRSYIVSSDSRTFAVHPDDVAWFLTRMVRGKALFSIVEVAPTSQLEITHVPFTVNENTPQLKSVQVPFIANEATSQLKNTHVPYIVNEDAPQIELDIQEEPTEKKRTRKSKIVDTQDTSLVE